MFTKILLIDDSKISRDRTRNILKKLEFEFIREAVDGLDGLKKYKELSPDLLITDIEMPNLDGISMIQKIREEDNKIGIIVLSSIQNPQTIQKIQQLNATVIKKPLKETHLLNAMKLLSR